MRVQDMEDDALVGVKSTARRLGRQAPGAILLFYALSAALAAAAAVTARLSPLFFAPFALFAAALALQVRRVKLDAPALALRLFKSNRQAGLLLLLALAAGAWR